MMRKPANNLAKLNFSATELHLVAILLSHPVVNLNLRNYSHEHKAELQP